MPITYSDVNYVIVGSADGLSRNGFYAESKTVKSFVGKCAKDGGSSYVSNGGKWQTIGY